MKLGNESFNLLDDRQCYKFIDYLKASNLKKYPFIIESLMSIAEISDISSNYKNKPLEQQPLAYTFYDHCYQRIKICINFESMEKSIHAKNGSVLTSDDFFMVVVHEFLHNLFLHVGHARPKLNEYSKQNHELVNFVLDFYCNNFITELFDKSPEKFNLPMIHFSQLNNLYYDFTSSPLPFKKEEQTKIPLEETILKKLFEYINSNNNRSPNNIEEGFDDHEIGKSESEKSKGSANKEREKNGLKPLTSDEFDKLSELKINSNIEQASKSASLAEQSMCRFLGAIKKKDPFLNFIKIKETLKLVSAEHFYHSYSKPNRKKVSNEGVIYKGKKKEEGKFCVVGIDVSGSIRDADLIKIYDIVGTFLDSNSHHTAVDVIFWSSCKITDKHKYKNITSHKELLKLVVNSSGGTDVNTLYDFVKEEYKNKKVTLINITDGCYNYTQQSENISQEYIILTEEHYKEEIKKAYPKAQVRCILVRE